MSVHESISFEGSFFGHSTNIKKRAKEQEKTREATHARIGLIGHSGGSTASNLTIRIEKGFRAYVSDLTIDYCERGTLFEPFHCQTVPQLYPYHLWVNDFDTSDIPVKRVDYGYTNGMDEIFRFFDEHLKD